MTEQVPDVGAEEVLADLVERVERLEGLVEKIVAALGIENVEPASLEEQVKASRDRARARRERKVAR